MITRFNSQIFGLGHVIHQEDAIITGPRLPTYEQVLRCMIWNVSQLPSQIYKQNLFTAAKGVLVHVVPFYEKGGIPMKREDKCCHAIIDFLLENQSLRKIPLKRRNCASSLQKVEQMHNKLCKTFPFWPTNALEMMKNQEDIAFLISMQSDRSASFVGSDVGLTKKVKRIEKRKLDEVSRVENERKRKLLDIERCNDPPDIDCESDTDIFVDYTPKIPRQARRIKTGTTININHDILKNPRLTSFADRVGLTPAEQSVFLKILIEECGGDPKKVSLSYSTAHRQVISTN